MPDLKAVEQFLQAFIVDPGSDEQAAENAARSLGMQAVEAAERLVRPNAHLSSLERMQIYRDQYLARMSEALESDFAAVAHFLGHEGFHRLVQGYVEAYPSHSYTLNRLSDNLPTYIESCKGLPKRAFLHDLARLELAVTEVFDEEETPRLTPADVAAVPSEAWERARLVPVRAFRVMAFRYPANAYLESVQNDVDCSHPSIKRQDTWAVVWRRDYQMHRLPLTRPAFEMLDRLAAGAPLGEALQAAASGCGGVRQDQLFGWFSHWVSEGMFSRVVTG